MDDYPEHRRSGFLKSGLIGGLFLGLFHFIALIPNLEFFDWVTMIFSIPIYFFVARSAAENRYDAQREDSDPLDGVNTTGMGAIYIAVAISVAFLILREVIGNLVLGSNAINAASLCWLIPAQIAIAFIFGFMSVRMVIKNHNMEENG
ncbi:MAG: hypothetical protein AB9897_05415 [Anaerolineaceae bacterium]